MKTLSASESLTISLRRSEKLSHLSFQCRVLGATMISARPDISCRDFRIIFLASRSFSVKARTRERTTHALRRVRPQMDDRRSTPTHSPQSRTLQTYTIPVSSWAVLGIAYAPGGFAFRQAFSSLFGVAISILKCFGWS